MRLLEAIKQLCLAYGFDRTYWVGLSGGLDSTVLLHLLAQLRSHFPLIIHAVHIHHGLSPNADSWLKHCEKMCEEYAIELSSYCIDARTSTGESLEAVARQRRYEIFAQQMAANDIWLTGHHQDDQAETVLLQLFRGAGPKGLAAMPEFAVFNRGFHARPLLNFSRNVLEQYAKDHQLRWVDDESNAKTSFTRNFIRHEVLALLKTRWPNITETITRSAMHCAEAQDIIEDFSHHDLLCCYGSKPNTLSVSQLLMLPLSRQRQVIRLWFIQNNISIPSTVKMQHILQDMLRARIDKLPHVIWGEYELRRYRDDLYVMPRLQLRDQQEEFIWDLKASLCLPDIGVLHASPAIGEGVRSDIDVVSVRFRRGGEDCQLAGRKHHHSLKKLFQTWGVPPWMRDRVPLLWIGEQLVAVVGYGVADDFRANSGESGLILSCV